uniref:C-type lectin domain-containing protein n=1 Tax=Labrus bergylta TaxID=56723 RepID=A0A3Q3FHW6_9LABR
MSDLFSYLYTIKIQNHLHCLITLRDEYETFGFCTPILYALREFHYIDLKMNWTDAQQYCREKYTDLATIESMADNNRLKGTESTFTWIGLHDDPLSWKGIGGNERNSWRWSSTGEFTGRDNHNWRQSEPNYYCVYFYRDYTWGDSDCSKLFPFWCQTGDKKIFS